MQGRIKRIVLIVTAVITFAVPAFAQPLAFTKNMGQWPDSILFRANANGATMWFTKNGIWYEFSKRMEKPNSKTSGTSTLVPHPTGGILPQSSNLPNVERFAEEKRQNLRGVDLQEFDHEQDSIEISMVKAEFVDASQSVEVIGNEEMEYKCNYFIGNDPNHWHTDVPNYAGITMRGLYPGVDITFSTKDGRLQAEQIASSTDKLAQIKIAYAGSLAEHHFDGILLADHPVAKSESRVSSATSSESAVTLAYSTYLGGSDEEESLIFPFGEIAVDAMGNAYVTGITISSDFPIQNPFQTDGDIFITKINSAGTGLVYSTYLGGEGPDFEGGIAVDAGGKAYVTGFTGSGDFPTQNPFQASHDNSINYDAFVTKFNSTGNGLIYSTYLGGNGDDWSLGIAIDPGGNASITGPTWSTNFPTKNPIQASHSGGDPDIFVAKFSNTGTALVYSTYLGGSDYDESYGIAVDTGGNTYVTGYTDSRNFPTHNPFQASNGGGHDAFVTKFNSAGTVLVYSTYLGGSSGDDEGDGIAVDVSGNAYITGVSGGDFPIHNPFQAISKGGTEAFITKLNSAGTGLIYSTYLGGSEEDWGLGIAVDTGGNVYVTGMTSVLLYYDFPTQNQIQTPSGGGFDAFVTKLNSAGSGLIYSTYIGGDGEDFAEGIAVDARGNAYVKGTTSSDDFPTQNPFQASNNGGGDAFVTKFGSGSESVNCCVGVRGNVNNSGDITIQDLTYLVNYLFRSGPAPVCIDEANINGTGEITIQDLTYLVNFLFRSGPQPPACP